VIDIRTLFLEHKGGVREIPVASFRESYQDIHPREWQSWRERCEIPKGSRTMSRLSAIRLNVLTRSRGRLSDIEVKNIVSRWLAEDPDQIERWLDQHRWGVGSRSSAASTAAAQEVMNAINSFEPSIDVIHSRRLYEWFRRAGLEFSTRRSYSRQEIARVVAIARRGIGRGSRRSTAFSSARYRNSDIALFDCKNGQNHAAS
jgi:hypothetical protein